MGCAKSKEAKGGKQKGAQKRKPTNPSKAKGDKVENQGKGLPPISESKSQEIPLNTPSEIGMVKKSKANDETLKDGS